MSHLQRRWENRRRGDGDAETSSRLLSGRRRAHVTAKTRPGPCTVGRRCGRRRRPPPRRATEPAARRNGTDDKREKGGGRRPAGRIPFPCGGLEARGIRRFGAQTQTGAITGQVPIAGPAARGPGSAGIRGAIRWGPALSPDPLCWCPCPGPGESEAPARATTRLLPPVAIALQRRLVGSWQAGTHEASPAERNHTILVIVG